MIVFDTNVLSESLRPKPVPQVVEWLRSQPRAALFTTTITEAEILFGVALLPDGKRRKELHSAVTDIFAHELAGHILPFDSAAAREFAQLAAKRRHSGKPIAHADAQIAAIVRSRGAILATRNTADFEDCEIELINPWE